MRPIPPRPETDANPPDGPAPDAATRPARRAALRALRQRQHVEWAHGQTPTERLVAADELYALASAIGDDPLREDRTPLWLALKARWRRLVA